MLLQAKTTPTHTPSATYVKSTDAFCQQANIETRDHNVQQRLLADNRRTILVNDYQINAVAAFSAHARVLSRRDYSDGIEAGVSPTDLVLGWGDLSQVSMYRQLQIKHADRWLDYQWQPDQLPLPNQQIIKSIANMHLIPANQDIAEKLAGIRSEQVIALRGLLVNVRRDNDWRWQTSLRRDDIGAGACEIVYVCELKSKASTTTGLDRRNRLTLR